MTARRITIHDYPEHLNPFYEANNKSDRNSKYGTWGSSTRNKIRQTVLDSTWIEALNLSPAKKKVTKKWSLFKSHTVEKFQRSRSKSNSFEHTIQRPERRQSPINIRPQRLFSERFVATSTPVKAQTNAWTKETNQPELDNNYELQGAKPKIRKKKAAPRPPSSILTPDSDTSVDLGIWNMTDSVDSGLQQSPVDEEINAIAIDISVESEPSTDLHHSCSSEKTSHETTHIKPLIEQPNIATLISNNLTL